MILYWIGKGNYILLILHIYVKVEQRYLVVKLE